MEDIFFLFSGIATRNSAKKVILRYSHTDEYLDKILRCETEVDLIRLSARCAVKSTCMRIALTFCSKCSLGATLERPLEHTNVGDCSAPSW